MMYAMIGATLLSALLFLAAVWGAIWLAGRFLPRWASIAIAVGAFLFLLQNTIRGILFCSAPPVYVAPSTEDEALGSDGAMIFNCDAPMGAIDRLWLYILAPGLLVTLALTIWRLMKREPETT